MQVFPVPGVQREQRADQARQMTAMLDAIKGSAEAAVFLEDEGLAREIVDSLITSPVIAGAVIVRDDKVLAGGNCEAAGAGMPLSFLPEK